MSHYDYDDSPINTPSKKVTGPWIEPSKGGYQAKGPEFEVGVEVIIKKEIARHGGMVGHIKAPSVDGPYDWFVQFPSGNAVKFKESEMVPVMRPGTPPKNPASSSQSKECRSTESLLGEILEVLKEIREALKPKAPPPFGERGMGAVVDPKEFTIKARNLTQKHTLQLQDGTYSKVVFVWKFSSTQEVKVETANSKFVYTFDFDDEIKVLQN